MEKTFTNTVVEIKLFPTALKSQILFGIFLRKTFCLFFERCGCIRQKHCIYIFFVFVYCQQEHVRQEISCWNIQFWPGRNSAERITWVVTEQPEIALEDLRVIPTAIYHKWTLQPKTFPPSSVTAFSAVRSAAIRMMPYLEAFFIGCRLCGERR